MNPLFTGRRDIICRLRATIQKAVEDGPGQDPCHIVISCMGGEGKSEICLQLAYQLRKSFWGIFWVDVSTAALAEYGFLQITNRIRKNVSTWQAVPQELTNTKLPWLLVLDNADDPHVSYQLYSPVSGFGVVILTSRNIKCELYATKERIYLRGLPDEEARDLLLRAAGIPTTQTENLQDDAKIITQLLQSHALALIQVGSYIRRGHYSLEDYPQVYKRQRKRLLQFQPLQATSHYRSVYATFEASIKILKVSQIDGASDTLELLSILAMYASNLLPVSLFETARNQSYKEAALLGLELELNGLSRWHANRLPKMLLDGEDSWDSFRFFEALHLLKSFSLVSVETKDAAQLVSLHSLVHSWSRERLNEEQRHCFWTKAACLVAFARGNGDFWYHHQQRMVPHVKAICSWPTSVMLGIDSDHDIKAKICSILMACSAVLISMHDMILAKRLLDIIFNQLELNREKVDPTWLGVYACYAVHLIFAYRSKDAAVTLEQVVELEASGVASLSILDRHAQHILLVQAYQDEENPSKVLEYLRHWIEIEGQTAHHDERSWIYLNIQLGRTYHQCERLQESVDVFEQLLGITYPWLTIDSKYHRLAQTCLSSVYLTQGRFKKVIRMLQPEVESLRNMNKEALTLYGVEGPAQVGIQCNLAKAYSKTHQHSEAITILERVINVDMKDSTAENRNLLNAQFELAEAYEKAGRYHDAVKLAEHAATVMSREVSKKHPQRLIYDLLLARMLRKAGDRERAVGKLQRVRQMIERRIRDEDTSDGLTMLSCEKILAGCDNQLKNLRDTNEDHEDDAHEENRDEQDEQDEGFFSQIDE